MYKDDSSRFTLNFVGTSDDLPYRDKEYSSPDPESGILSRSLHNHPLLRFAAVAAATMVGMHVAGKVVREGGVKLIDDLAEGRGGALFRGTGGRLAKDLQNFGKTWYAWEQHALKGRPVDFRDFHAAASVTEKYGAWTFGDEIKNAMFKQARRLPYELPAAYATQRLIVDPLFGGQQSKERPNWKNPVDTIADFGQQSMKNLFAFMLPFDAGTEASKYGWRKLMTAAAPNAVDQGLSTTVGVSTQQVLRRVGQDFSKMAYNTMRHSQMNSGAFATALNESLHSSTGLVQHLYKTSGKSSLRDIRFADIRKAANPELLNVQIGPLGGMRRFGQSFAEQRRFIEQEISDREAIVGAPPRRGLPEGLPGGVRFEGGDPRKITARFRGAGYSKVEQFAHSIQDAARTGVASTDAERAAQVVRGGPDSPFRRGTFFRDRMTEAYKGTLIDELSHRLAAQGVSRREVEHIVGDLRVDNIYKLSEKKVTRGYLGERIQFGREPIKFGDDDEFKAELRRRLRGSGEFGKYHVDDIVDALHPSVTSADRRMRFNYDRHAEAAAKTWSAIYQQQILPHIKGQLGTARISYNDFLSMQEHAGDIGIGGRVVREELAERLGIHIPHNATTDQRETIINEALHKRGINQSSWEQIRGLLVQHGVVSPQWQEEGYNAFGFRPMTVQSALNRGYFEHQHPAIQTQIKRIAQDIGRHDPTLGEMNRIKLDGMWESSGGGLLDLTPFTSGVKGFFDIAAHRIQVPLVHIQPLMTGGYGAFQNLGQGGILRYVPGYSPNRFMGEKNPSTAFMWMGTGPRKGMLARIARDPETGEPITERIRGSFRAPSGDLSSLPGRALRATIPGRGIIADYTQNWFQDKFNIDTHQPGSFSRYLHRFRNRQDDIMNPSVFARKLLEAGEGIDESVQGRARHTRAFENLLGQYSKSQVAQAQENLERELSRYGFGGKIASNIGEDLFDVKSTWTPIHAAAEAKTFEQMLTYGSPQELLHYVRGMTSEDLVGLDDLTTAKLNVAQRRLNTMLASEHQEGGRYFRGAASRAKQATGINTRLDEFKEELRRYVLLRRVLLDPGVGQMPPDLMGDLLGALEKNRSHFSGGELAEFKAAILGTQIEWMRINSRQIIGSNEQSRLVEVARHLSNPANLRQRSLLENIASNNYRLGRSTVKIPYVGDWLKAAYLRRFSTAADEMPNAYNPFGGNARHVVVPTFMTSVQRAGLPRALKSVTGLTSYSDPQAFSLSSTPIHHFFTRLNRYFQLLGGGLDESRFKGPLGFYSKGLVGRRVLPLVAAASVLHTVDATLGGYTHKKDDQGNRDYAPLVEGHAARGFADVDALLTGLTPGGLSFRQKRQQLLHGEFPVRKGRFWPLGNTPILGGRIQYFRPSWTQRAASGYKNTPQTFGSPMERLLYYNDFSPLRPFAPYKFEKKHYEDRPYPITGEYFSGPWGPLTSALNLTAGRILKPPKFMHREELNAAITGMQPVGRSAMIAPRAASPADTGRLYTKVKGRPSVVSPDLARNILSDGATGQTVAGQSIPGQVVAEGNLKGETLTAVTPIPARDGQDPDDTDIGIPTPGRVYSYGKPDLQVKAIRRSRGIAAIHAGSGSGLSGYKQAKITIAQINKYYQKAANGQYPLLAKGDEQNLPILQAGSGMSPRTLARTKPQSATSEKMLSSSLGYESQELFGIYGWGFGALRHTLGLGRGDLSPRGPVLTAASRAYGSERSFWDLNLGGLGDTPLPFEGEYSNLEFSEITRRFIPHRRRDLTEYNPIPNSVGQKYPWLPGSNYFINFQQGDPYALIPEGEMRLPGAGYEKFHKLHPDATGAYGLIDKFKILGDVAPYSDEYRAMNQMMSRLDLSDDQRAIVKQTRSQVSQQNKRHEFNPYIYAHQDFASAKARITGRVEGTADQYWTDKFDNPIRLAGVRARSVAAQSFMDKHLKPGTKVSLTYDANEDPLYGPTGAIDVIAKSGRRNLSDVLLNSGYGNMSRTNTPLEARMRTNKATYPIKQLGELISHRNTYINSKFLPHKTPVEAWERQNVYGATFAQWHHPVKDFLEPMIYKGTSRNPVAAMLGMGVVGAMFGTDAQTRRLGGIIGASIGLGASTLVNANKYGLGERFMPLRRKQELGVEEYADILNYVKYQRLYNQARGAAEEREKTDPEVIARQMENAPKGVEPPISAVGPITAKALQFRKQTRQTMYGAEPFGDVMDIYTALPKRKRDFFLPFLEAPKRDRQRILSTAGRLERRIYEAKWKMPVEQRPELTGYFKKHELPGPDWEGWSPDVPMESVKLKIIQHAGLDASQMGYYPQQVSEANLQNPTYPNMDRGNPNELQVRAQLQQLMGQDSRSNNVRIMRTAYPGTRVLFNVGAN